MKTMAFFLFSFAAACCGGIQTDLIDSAPVECVTDDDCQIDVPCSGREICQNGKCFPGPGIDLLDSLQCTDDICDLITGEITHPPVMVDDNNPCTDDGCTEGVGIWNVPIPNGACFPSMFCASPVGLEELAGAPCVENKDCVTGSPCVTGICNKFKFVCELFYYQNGTECGDGLCDGGGRCCYTE